MRNKFPLIIILLGLLLICSLEAQTDNRLNGRWVAVVKESTLEYRFNNGSFEISVNGILNEKGTYIINNGKIILTSTHVHGDISTMFNTLFNTIFDYYGQKPDSNIKLDSKWYTINEFIIAIRPQLINLFLKHGLPESNVDEAIASVISSSDSVPYSVDNNSLIISKDGTVVIFNKK